MRINQLTILFCLLTNICFSQNVGINTATPNPSAALDIQGDKLIFLGK